MIMEVLMANDSAGVSTCMSSTTCSRGTTATCKSATSISAVVVAIAAGALLVVLVSVAVCSGTSCSSNTVETTALVAVVQALVLILFVIAAAV